MHLSNPTLLSLHVVNVTHSYISFTYVHNCLDGQATSPFDFIEDLFASLMNEWQIHNHVLLSNVKVLAFLNSIPIVSFSYVFLVKLSFAYKQQALERHITRPRSKSI